MKDNVGISHAEGHGRPARRSGNVQFIVGDHVVYPGHGVGTVTSIETLRVGEHDLSLFAISFAQDRMTLRVPMQKVESSGLRRLSTRRVMEGALAKLKEPAVRSSALWNRRSMECAAKINSGDPCLIAEVVRDLHSVSAGREPSHSQRVLYEQALGRLVQEVAAIENSQIEEATAKLELMLNAA